MKLLPSSTTMTRRQLNTPRPPESWRFRPSSQRGRWSCLLCRKMVFLSCCSTLVVGLVLVGRLYPSMGINGLGWIFLSRCLGLGLRHGVFDGAISISAVQWLCNADKSCNKPTLRLKLSLCPCRVA